MPYEIIDHTADLGIRVTAPDLTGLFETAAMGMFEQMTDLSRVREIRRRRLDIRGSDLSDLLINWLRELFSVWTLHSGLVARTAIEKLTDREIEADIFYDPYDPDRHEILTEIKAVTYSGIMVEKNRKGWKATVIFDI